MTAEPYEITFREDVARDLQGLDRRIRRQILDAIEHRLPADPDLFGKPLGGAFRGLRRIRSGDQRVVYQVTGRRVVVWAILNRKSVYSELARRLLRKGCAS